MCSVPWPPCLPRVVEGSGFLDFRSGHVGHEGAAELGGDSSHQPLWQRRSDNRIQLIMLKSENTLIRNCRGTGQQKDQQHEVHAHGKRPARKPWPYTFLPWTRNKIQRSRGIRGQRHFVTAFGLTSQTTKVRELALHRYHQVSSSDPIGGAAGQSPSMSRTPPKPTRQACDSSFHQIPRCLFFSKATELEVSLRICIHWSLFFTTLVTARAPCLPHHPISRCAGALVLFRTRPQQADLKLFVLIIFPDD